jgi:hypothetical protein
MNRFDVTRRLRRISERPAQIANAAGESGVAHDRVTPHRREQFVFRDQPPRVLDQVPEDGKRPRHQLQPLLSAPRPLVPRLDPNRG